MPIYKYPLALWTDPAGNTSACTIDGVPVSAVGVDDSDAISQIKKYLNWHYQKTPWDQRPDFVDPQIGEITVALRPQFNTEQGRYPSASTIQITFAYVWGSRPDQSIVCCLPTLDRSFRCTRPGAVETLAREEVLRHFADSTTSDIAQTLSPSKIRTTMINVRVPIEKIESGRHQLESLPQIAVALGERDGRRQFSRAWGRDEEVERLKSELQNGRTNILLIGEAGIGKTTVLADAVRQLRKESLKDQDAEQPSHLQQVERYWLSNASRLIAGMSFLGQWEERVEEMIDELAEIRGVLCIENLLTLARTGSTEPAASLAGFFRYFMLADELRMVAECTRTELEVIRRLLPGFDSLFQFLPIDPMSNSQSLKTLTAISNQFNQQKKFEIEERAISQTRYLFKRFLPYDHFPGKCVLFWRKQLQQLNDSGNDKLDVDDVISSFVDDTGLPRFLVCDEIPLTIGEVNREFESQIIGQPAACHAAAQVVMSFKAGMNDPQRPIGVQLFCGPTGVGKTELAKTMARYLFGASEKSTAVNDRNGVRENGNHGQRLLRLDMSEYGLPGAAEKLLTDSDGNPSLLVKRMRETPFMVLLLDEIEKAAPEVFDALMTMFDEGRMVDRLGRTVNFCSAVIVMTSNLGSSGKDPIGFNSDDGAGYEKAVQAFFRPEFFNRLDRIITFDHLSPESILKIAESEVSSLEKREGLVDRNIKLKCTREALEVVARIGYDRRLGARPLQRTIELNMVAPLARWMVDNPEIRNVTLTFVCKENSIELRYDGLD